MTDLMRTMLPVLATEGDNGFLIAADTFDESWDAENQRFGRLLRKYVEIQTYVRMSQPIPLEMANEYKALNDTFSVNNSEPLGVYGCHYEMQLGPFFLKLSADQDSLANNLKWLEAQPIRELYLSEMQPGNDLGMIFRNHRFQSLKRVTIRPDYRVRDVATLAKCVREMTAHSLQTLTFEYGVADRLGLIKAAFAGNKTIPPGAELFLQRNRIWVHK